MKRKSKNKKKLLSCALVSTSLDGLLALWYCYVLETHNVFISVVYSTTVSTDTGSDARDG